MPQNGRTDGFETYKDLWVMSRNSRGARARGKKIASGTLTHNSWLTKTLKKEKKETFNMLPSGVKGEKKNWPAGRAERGMGAWESVHRLIADHYSDPMGKYG